VLDKAIARGVSEKTLATLGHSGIDLAAWLRGFNAVEEGVKGSVEIIRNHPLLPPDVPVHGLIIHPTTGKLDVVIEGYATAKS
jgi:carbonic anhydrase